MNMIKRLLFLLCVLCVTTSVAAVCVATAPQIAFGGTCEKIGPNKKFNYKTEAECEKEFIPGVFDMYFPTEGEWVLKIKAAFAAGGHEVSEPLAFKEKVTTGTYVMKGEVSGVKTKITCTSATALSGHLEEEGTATANIKFSECTVNEPASCTVEQPITLSTVDGDLPTTTRIEFYPKESETFATLSYLGSSCSAKGSYKLTGGQACALDAKIETEEAIHSITCATTGSNLNMACAGMTLETTAIDFELEGGKTYRTEV
jgi:hypothetical protein